MARIVDALELHLVGGQVDLVRVGVNEDLKLVYEAFVFVEEL